MPEHLETNIYPNFLLTCKDLAAVGITPSAVWSHTEIVRILILLLMATQKDYQYLIVAEHLNRPIKYKNEGMENKVRLSKKFQFI